MLDSSTTEKPSFASVPSANEPRYLSRTPSLRRYRRQLPFRAASVGGRGTSVGGEQKKCERQGTLASKTASLPMAHAQRAQQRGGPQNNLPSAIPYFQAAIDSARMLSPCQ